MASPIIPLCIGAACYAIARNRARRNRADKYVQLGSGPQGVGTIAGSNLPIAPKWPPPPLTPQQAMIAESGSVVAAVASACSPTTHKCTKTIEKMTSHAWQMTYGYKGVVIPPHPRSPTWDPWVEAWERMIGQVMDMAEAYS